MEATSRWWTMPSEQGTEPAVGEGFEGDTGSEVDPTHDGGGLHVLYRLAAAGEPLTAAEVADRTGASKKHVQQTLLELFRSGYVIRRRRTPNTTRGGPAKEYVVCDPRDGGPLTQLYRGPPEEIERRLRKIEEAVA